MTVKKIKWKKLGNIISPQENVDWMAAYVGPSFAEVFDDHIKIYATGRCKENISRIGLINYDIEKLKIISIDKQPLFDIGSPGCFDERGVSYPWIVDQGETKYMYYVGWVSGGLVRFQNFTGLAYSKDQGKNYRRYIRTPILDRTDSEPIGTGSCAVLFTNNKWQLWYTSFVQWKKIDNQLFHYYHIKYAESEDGINWKRGGVVAIDFKNDRENTIGKPMVLIEDGKYKMYYSFRSIDSLYRIGYAESPDGINWQRLDEQLDFDVSAEGWDSEMVEYAYIFNYKSKQYMIYNGNDFGKTGLGLAVLDD